MQTPNQKPTDALVVDATGIPKDTPISNRKVFYQGSGQLCSKGYMELYTHRSEDETTVSLNEMNELIRLSRE